MNVFLFLRQIISYTFPSSAPINYPFNDVVMYGERYVDYFNLYRATDEHVQEALDFGLAPEKVFFCLASMTKVGQRNKNRLCLNGRAAGELHIKPVNRARFFPSSSSSSSSSF